MILTDRGVVERLTEAGMWGDATLPDLFQRAVSRTPDKPALVDPPNRIDVAGGYPRRLSYAQSSLAVKKMVRAFVSLDLKPDDVVAFQLANTVEQVIVMLAGWECGLIVSPLPLLWREHELRTALSLIGPKVLITSSRISGRDHLALIDDAAEHNPTVRAVMAFGETVHDGAVALDPIFSDETDLTSVAPPSQVHVPSANDVATICWAGGEAPGPCPVPRSHNQWIAAGTMAVLEAGIDERSSILCPYPLNSLVPLGVFMVPWLLAGGTLVLHHPFEMKAFLEQLRTESPTVAGLPPAVIDLMKSEYGFGIDVSPSGLKTIFCVWPGPLLPKNAGERAVLSVTDLVDVRAIGEMAYVAKRRTAGGKPAELDHGTMTFPTGREGGVALLQTRVRGGISNNKQRSSLLGGDLMISSPMQFDDYYHATANRLDDPHLAKDADGYVNTGLRCTLAGASGATIDILRCNSDVIFHGGLSVSARELDRLYTEFHGISEAIAFAFDDPVMGERILAAVVPQPGVTVAFDEFVDYLNRRQVASYKFPDRLVTVSTIPRDRDGTVLRDRVFEYI